MSRDSHVVTVSDLIWKYAQVQSGLKNPAGWIRDHWIVPGMMRDIEESLTAPEAPPEPEPAPVDPWAELGMELSPIDPEFGQARALFITQSGGEDKALQWFRDAIDRGIRDPRAMLMSWWHKQKPQVV